METESWPGRYFSFVEQSGQDFLSETVSDRKFYPTGFFQKTPSDRIFYPKRFRIDNSIRRVFWQTLSDRISYPKLFWIENCIRQIFPPRKLINHYKQTVYQSVTKIFNRKFVFFLQIICISPPLSAGTKGGGCPNYDRMTMGRGRGGGQGGLDTPQK